VNRLSVLLLVLGGVVVLGSAGWWWVTYSDVIQYNYISVREASLCLVGDSEICQLARTLCRGAHPIALAAYRAATIWVGLAALSASLMTLGWARDRTASPRRAEGN